MSAVVDSTEEMVVAESSDVLLDVRNIDFSYDQLQVLFDISLEVRLG